MQFEFDLSLLRTFVAVASTGSFTVAGERLFRTQPAISQRIKRLEGVVGVSLIARSPDGIELTREGELLLGYAKQLLSLNDEAMRRMTADAPPELIRLGLPEDAVPVPLDTVLERFAVSDPSALVVIETRPAPEIDSGFAKGQYDVVLRQLPALSDAESLPLRLVWVGRAQTARPINGAVPLALFPEGSLFRRVAVQALTEAGRPWRVACQATSWTTLRGALLAGLGVTVIAEDMLDPGLEILASTDQLPQLAGGVAVVECAPQSSSSVRRMAELMTQGLRKAGKRDRRNDLQQ